MKRLLSSAVTAVLLLALGTLTFVVLPSTETAARGPAAPNAPTAAQNWNAVAMPLDATDTLSNAQALADDFGGSVQQLLRWDSSIQNWDWYIPPPVGPMGNNFDLEVGGAYFVYVDSTAPTTYAIVGDVPPPGYVSYNLVGASPTCLWNSITVPLDHDHITDAQGLADDIGDVDQLLMWDAGIQNWDWYIPPPVGPMGNNFSTRIGYPYFVCLSANKTWP